MNDINNTLINFYRQLQPEGVIPLHEPTISDLDKEYVLDCLDSGWVSTAGKYVTLAESKIAEYIGVEEAVATVNGTSALHLALLSVGVNPDDEVITPSLTFVATTNAIHYCHALPHFVDVETNSLCVCPDKLRLHLANVLIRNNNEWVNRHTQRTVKAIVFVHIFGLQGQIEEVSVIAKEYGLALIEDCAESLGTKVNGTHTGLFGDAAAFSFNGNKIITSGGGGMVIAKNTERVHRIKHLSTTAKTSKEGFFYHDEVGYNYRMPNLNAALLVGQLSNLDEKIAKKKYLYHSLLHTVQSHQEVEVIQPKNVEECNHWLLSLKVSPEVLNRNIEVFNQHDILARPLWNLNHTLPMYKNCYRADLSNSLSLASQIISLPSSPLLFK